MLGEFLKMDKVSNVPKVLNCLPMVIIFLVWKELLRFRTNREIKEPLIAIA